MQLSINNLIFCMPVTLVLYINASVETHCFIIQSQTDERSDSDVTTKHSEKKLTQKTPLSLTSGNPKQVKNLCLHDLEFKLFTYRRHC